MEDAYELLDIYSNKKEKIITNYDENPLKLSYIKDNMTIPISNEKEIKTFKFPSDKFNFIDECEAKVILLIGQTGSGKTTLINFLINSLLGVKYDDDFRFKIIVEEKRLNEAKSNTLGVNVYNIKIDGYSFPIKIIDCQGIGDTRGTMEDEKLIPKLKELFESINHINCICFVIKESDIRLGSAQQYIYKLILDLFSKDVKENFVLMITHSHFEETPQVINTLKLEESFFNVVIPNLKEPYYFQFENGSLYSKVRNRMNKLFFEESAKNMNKFLKNKLIEMKSVPTNYCVRVCLERLQQKIICQNILEKRKHLIEKRKLLEKNKKELSESKDKIIKDPNIKFNNTYFIIKEKYLEEGKKNTVCKECKENCHLDCLDTTVFGVDILKYWCICFDKVGFCKVCNKKCFMDSHELVNYEYYFEKVEVKLTLEQLYQRKKKNCSEKVKKEIDKLDNIILISINEIRETEEEINKLYKELRESLFQLNEIALNQFNSQLIFKILDELIEQEKEIGNLETVKSLKLQKRNYLTMNKVEESEDAEENNSLLSKSLSSIDIII